ncbi:MAG: peptidase C14 [Proteobacteria bacterium ST_bin13]|nr:MAG: peptidase C14 [Proteobacteria bacterium ST_bin13]
MARKALVVGIDHYQSCGSLYGCVNDAHSVKAVLERNSDGTVNFGVKLLAASGETNAVNRKPLKAAIIELFSDNSDVALLYFAGHGHIEATGGYILSSDSNAGDEGIPLSEILTFANQSKAKSKIIILDSCHSGIAGTPPGAAANAELSEGLTIMTASTAEQYATEEDGNGVFTTLLVDALNGAAANLLGEVTPGSVYAHIDQSLGEWDQRPVFKTNVKNFVSLRKVQPPISLAELHMLKDLFPSAGFQFQLDPDFEPESPTPNNEKCQKFGILQKYNRVNLLVPVDAPHMWHAAMASKTCRLTVLGEHYRRLVQKGRI